MGRIKSKIPTIEERRLEMISGSLDDEANRNSVSEETNCSLLAVKKEHSIVSVKIEPGLAAKDMETVLTTEEAIRATVQVAKTLKFTT